MKKVTILYLLAFFALLDVAGQLMPQAKLKSSPWDTYVLPDSLIIKKRDGGNRSKVTFTYDGEKEINDYYQWNDVAAVWNAAWSREEIYYNNNGNIANTIVYIYTNSEWTIYYKTNQTYNEKGVLTGIFYNEGVLNAEYTVTSTFTEGSDTQVASAIYRLKTGSDTINDYRYDYEYDATGNVLSEIYLKWDADTWKPANKTQYAYNETGMLIEETYFEAAPSDEWSPKQKWIYYYDGIIKNRMNYVDAYEWNNNLNAWTADWQERYLYYYKGVSYGIETIAQSTAKIWAYDQTIHIESEVDLASVSIYGITGNLLYQQTAKGNTIVFTAPVRNGIYLVKVKEVNGKSKTTKLIIR